MGQWSMPKLIGILGGMGPAATLDLQHKILDATPATRDQDHIPIVVWNVPQIPDRLAAVSGDGPSPLPMMLKAAQALQSVGATAIAMPCNTAHHWADELQGGLDIPLLHIADAVMDSLPDDVRCFALLSTPATVEAGFYQRRFHSRGIDVLLPDADEGERLMAAIHLVKAGRLLDAQSTLVDIGIRLLARGADRLLLACTELPLLSPGTAVEAQCVDPTDALARACIRHALQEPSLDTVPRGTQLA
ncbi:MAG: amino acid racemase [Betaproteobacteria bacterium]|nr:amino acid racemase [Betaproteobacteria bacterium]